MNIKASLLMPVVVAACVIAAPAHAVDPVKKEGGTSCTSNQHVAVNSLSYGTTKHYAPSGTLIATYNLSNVASRRTHTNYSSVTWKVTTTGGLDAAGTYGSCEAGGPF